MRLVPLLTALVVVSALFMLVFQREAVLEYARKAGSGTEMTTGGADAPTDDTDAEADADTDATETDAPRGVSVVAIPSQAREIDSAVLLRGRTEATRQLALMAETSGQVISEPLRKGAFVEAGQTMCRLDPGTREASLAEAQARLAEARAQAPQTAARVTEAQARLDEAMINLNAAEKLSEGGFASDTRVASARAAVEAARAGVVAAESGKASQAAAIQSAQAAVAAAQREIGRLEITAPFAGHLESDTAELGSLMQPGALCATIVQLDPIKLVGFQAGGVRVGSGCRQDRSRCGGRGTAGQWHQGGGQGHFPVARRRPADPHLPGRSAGAQPRPRAARRADRRDHDRQPGQARASSAAIGADAE